MRNLLVLLVFLAMTGVSSYAQEATQDTRTLQLYMDANSGTVSEAPDSTKSRLWSGNCIDVGMNYSHKFGNVPWLTLTSKVRWIAKIGTEYDKNGDYAGRSTDSVNADSFRARVGLSFSTPVGISVTLDTRGLMTTGLSYNIRMGSAGTIGIAQENCLYAVPKAKSDTNYSTGYNGVTIMELSSFNLSYSVPVATGWTYQTAVKFQLSGSGFEREEIKKLEDAFRIRWENRISYAATPSLGLWGQVRYQIENIANDSAIDHKVYLQAGINYKFDMSGL